MEVAGFAYNRSFKLAVVHLDIQRLDEHGRGWAPSAHNYAFRYEVGARRSDVVLDCPGKKLGSISKRWEEDHVSYFVSHRRPVSVLIQSSPRPLNVYRPGATSLKRSPVWKSPSGCLRDLSGQSGESATIMSSSN